MEIGETLYVTTAKQWRAWLKKHHKKKNDIWLIYYRKSSGKPRISYHDAVEQALCFGWIDSIQKKYDDSGSVQRFSPRKKGSPCSEINKTRARKMIAEGQMTQAGLDALAEEKDLFRPQKVTVKKDIEAALKKESHAWKHFQKFPASYKRIRLAFIEGARKRPEIFKKRLQYFVKMTAQNKRFGMIQE